MLRLLFILATAGLLFALAGCGNKGPLYRPHAEATASTTPAPSASSPIRVR